MATKKKRRNQGIGDNSPLYTPSKVLCVSTTDGLRSQIDRYRDFYRDNQEKLGILYGVDFANTDTLAFRDVPKRWSFSKDELSTFSSTIINLSVGLWTKKRIVYQFTQEAFAFICSDDPAFHDDLDFYTAMLSLSGPFMAQLPDGSGFLVSDFTLETEALCGKMDSFHHVPAYLIDYYGAEGEPGFSGMVHPDLGRRFSDICKGKMDAVFFRNTETESREFEHNGFNEEQQQIIRKIFRAVVYISYLAKLHSSQTTLMGMEARQAGSPWVMAVKVPGMQPNWNFAPPIATEGFNVPAYGIHPYLGFLSAGTLRTFARSLPEPEDPETDKLFEDIGNKDEFYVLRDWLDHCSVFVVKERVEAYCKKRLDQADLSEMPRDLFSYIPVKELVIWFEQTHTVSIVSLREKDHVYIRTWGDLDNGSFLNTYRVWNDAKDWKDHRAMPILYHIANYYIGRAMDWNTGIPRTAVNHNTKGAVPASEVPVSAAGYDVSLDGIRLLDVTQRAVKTVSHRDRVSRYGWRMPTHVRRGHIHRFWVGSGDDRHLEAKWVEPIVVNRDLDPVIRTHEVKE